MKLGEPAVVVEAGSDKGTALSGDDKLEVLESEGDEAANFVTGRYISLIESVYRLVFNL